jgi:capsular exopolysaccharide synthesis family protein
MARRALSPGELWQLREADPIRQTRTALLLLLKRGGGNVVGVTSTVRDEGHTAALCNLAVATADAGLKVVLIDGDLRRPNLSRYFGLEPEPGLRSLLIGDAPLADAVRPAEVNLDLVSSAPVAADATALLTSKAMADLVATLRRRYDIVLVNVPPLLSDAAAALVASNTDGCILVVPYGRTSENDVAEATEILKSASVRLLGTMMTMVPHGARVRDAGGGRRIVAAPERSAPVPHAASADESPAAPPPLAAAPVSDDGNGHGPAMPTAVTAALRPGGLPSPRPRDSGPPAG